MSDVEPLNSSLFKEYVDQDIGYECFEYEPGPLPFVVRV